MPLNALASQDWFSDIIRGMDKTNSTPGTQGSSTAKPSLDPTLAWLERAQANSLRMTLDPEYRRQVEQRLLFTKNQPKP
jgi:hypothetical protein